jgi:exosortase A
MSYAWPAARFGGAGTLAPWRTPMAALALSWVGLLALFHRDVADLAGIYWHSTTFGHCLFILPVTGWLVWGRRPELAALTPVGWWPGLLLVAAGAGGWFLGELAGVSFARHLGLVMLLQAAVIATLGPNVARGLMFPIAYLLFLVPFGAWLEAPLQEVTVAMTMWGLGAAGVPASAEGVLITISNGYFEVAEACSGTKFVIAMGAFSALAGNVCFVGRARRAAFVAVALVAPVIANGVRAWGTIYAAHLTSMEAAAGADHIIYGWVFFAGVIALVLALGWRWFDRDPDARWFDPASLQGRVRHAGDARAAAGGVLGLAALALAAGTLVGARADALLPQLTMPEVPGWTRTALSTRAPWTPWYPTADHRLIGRYADGRGAEVDLAIAVFGGQRDGKELVSYDQGVLRPGDGWVRVTDEAALASGSMMRITAPGPVERSVATWYVLRGRATSSERVVKIETLKAKLFGGPQRGVVVHLSAEAGGRVPPRAAMARFLAAAGPVERLAARVAAGR